MNERSDSADPPSVSLEVARQAARTLRTALARKDGKAIARFREIYGGEKDVEAATLGDCLNVVAREAGAESWSSLRTAVDIAGLDGTQRAAMLARAVANGNFGLVDRLLSLDPSLADAHLGIQLALVRTDAALHAISADPTRAATPIGGRWPIHYLCFSKLHQRAPETRESMIVLLDALLAAGADVNQRCPVAPGADHELSALYGAIGHAENLPLAEALLQRGADPNDNESLYHATELPNLDGVRLLFAHGAKIAFTNAFYRMLDRESLDGVRLFLENGANPNDALYAHPSETPADPRNALHHAIIRGRSGDVGALLIDHGVDTTARYDGRAPYALAVACGNASMARMLENRNLATPLSDAERFLACIANLDAEGARALLAARPGLWQDLTDSDLERPATLAMTAEALPMLRLMAELGFDPNRRGESDSPPIHSAAWWGHADIVAMYVGLGVDLEIRNMFGGTALGTAIHGSMNCPGRDDGDYPRCVGLLLEAGAQILPEQGHLEMGSEVVTALLDDRMEAARRQD